MNKRDKLARVVRTLRIEPVVSALSRNALTVVNYHRVAEPGAVALFDEGVLEATPRQFDEQMAFLKKHYNLLDPGEFRQCLQGRPWPKSPALVTFDDGYRDNYHCVLPILQKHGVKALFSIVTDNVENRRVFWWDRISYLLKRTTLTKFPITYPRSQVINLSRGVSVPSKYLRSLVTTIRHLDLNRFLAELADAARVPWTESQDHEYADELLMNWQEIKALRAAGMTIGSHTRTHRELGILPQDQLESELKGSKRDIEAALGESIWSIAYPVGHPLAGAPAVLQELKQAAYEVGFTYGTGVQPLSHVNPFDVARLGVERDWSLARFSIELSGYWEGQRQERRNRRLADSFG